jgi:hypothetical protein
MAQPVLALSLTALSLLLLVLVLLSVPGPIKDLYWFSIPAEVSGMGKLSAGVLGWCEIDTSNCTYAPLSYVSLFSDPLEYRTEQGLMGRDNRYLSDIIDTGMALTVRIMLPLGKSLSIMFTEHPCTSRDAVI